MKKKQMTVRSEAIESFDYEYAFLSNFYPCKVEYEGMYFSSVECAYQAAKTLDKDARKSFQTIRSGEAKKKGKKLTLRPDWDEVKIGIMEQLLECKFNHPGLRKMLEATKGKELVEGNWWGDKFWGVCEGQGLNWLGKLLMKVRDKQVAK